jgi:hypothetical protein
MPEDKPSSQSMSFRDSKMEKSQFGGLAGRDLNVTNTQQMGTAAKSLKPEDVEVLLSKLESLLKASDLPEEQKTKALQHIGTAKEEALAAEPDKDFAAKSLKRATTVLKEAGATVEAGTSLWDKVKPVLETLSPWLKVAAGFFF